MLKNIIFMLVIPITYSFSHTVYQQVITHGLIVYRASCYDNMNCLCITSTINGNIYGIIKTTDNGKTWFRDAVLDGTAHMGRIVQRITFADETLLHSTLRDGLWLGTYIPSDIKSETSDVNISIRSNPATDSNPLSIPMMQARARRLIQ